MIEQQTQVPEGWDYIELDNLFDRISNGTTEKQFSEPPGLPVTRIETISEGVVNLNKVKYLRELSDEKKTKFSLKKGDVLFSHINSDLHLGKTAIVKQSETLVHGMNLLLMRFKDVVSPEYMHYLFNWLRFNGFFISIAQHAVNQSSLNQRKIKAIKVPLAPSEQQKQIVAKIEELFSHIDAGIESLKSAQEKLKKYRQSVLKAAVTGELTKEWREQNASSIEPADQLLKRIQTERRQRWEQQKLAEFQAKGKPPKNDKWKEKYKEPLEPEVKVEQDYLSSAWVLAGIETVAMEIVDCLHSTAKFIEAGFYCIDTNSMSESDILFDKARFVSEQTYFDRIRRLKPEEGDVLFSREGTIGKTAIVPENVDLCLGQRMMMFRFIKDVAPEYAKLFLLSPIFKTQWKGKISGTTSPHVNISDIRKMFFLVPPKEEQKEIVQIVEEKLSSADRLMNEIETKLTQAQQQKQSILASAFKGEII